MPDDDAIPVLSADVPVTMPEIPARLVISTPEQYKAMGDPIRSNIIRMLGSHPMTAKQIAGLLKETPGAIGYHLQILENAGFVQIVAKRSIKGIIAKYYARTARLFLFEEPGEIPEKPILILNFINEAREEIMQMLEQHPDIFDGYTGFPHARVSQEKIHEFAERMKSLIDDFVDSPYEENGVNVGFLFALFHAPPYTDANAQDN